VAGGPSLGRKRPKEGIRVVATDSQKCWHDFAATSLRLRRRNAARYDSDESHGRAVRSEDGPDLAQGGLVGKVGTGLCV
jgi:hypothetical protein